MPGDLTIMDLKFYKMKAKIIYPCMVMLLTLSIFSSCKKDAKTSSTKTTTQVSSLNATGDIALSAASTDGSKDTIFLVHCFPPHGNKDSVAFSALPTAIGTYLTANYSGYTFVKAFKVTDSLNVANGYVVIIKYNDALIGLKFSTTGAFVNVLEQMDGHDMGPGGKGWHPGGPFCDRGGIQQDTLALSAVPSAVLTYFTSTYPTDTLLHAYKTPDTTYILISKNVFLYATNISAAGNLIKRVKIGPLGGPARPIKPGDLPAAITTYLNTTYPGYVIVNVFADGGKSGITAYHVFITVNDTNYVVDFDSSGSFQKATVIH